MPSAAYRLLVTKPCHEAWSSMTDTGDGRHCRSCNKMVTDFSTLDDEEIKNYFLKAGDQPVCGRFKTSQLDRIKICIPTYLLHKPIPFWKKFLVVFLICFGSNLYPFDIIVGNRPNLYAQTTAVKKGDKKVNGKHKKKKYILVKKNEIKFDFPAEIMTLGFTQMIPIPETFPIADILSTKIMSTVGGLEDAENSIQIKADNQSPKKSPAKKPSENKIESLLPAGLNYRRRIKAPAKSR